MARFFFENVFERTLKRANNILLQHSLFNHLKEGANLIEVVFV